MTNESTQKTGEKKSSFFGAGIFAVANPTESQMTTASRTDFLVLAYTGNNKYEPRYKGRFLATVFIAFYVEVDASTVTCDVKRCTGKSLIKENIL